VKILVVCGVGLGSSHILRLTVRKALARLGVKATVEVSDLTSAPSMLSDLWVSLTEFADALRCRVPADSRHKVVGVKSIVDVDEVVAAIRKALGE